MKYKAPHDCPELSVGGETFTVDKDGNITVPDTGDYATLLTSAGCTPVIEAAAPVVEKPGKQA